MQIGSRFTIGVHILSALDFFKGMDGVNSEFLAGSIGINPVIVRNVISQLRRAGIVRTRRGAGGAELARSLDQVSLYDIYRAVDSVDEEEGLFHFHEQPNPACPVGGNIHTALDRHLEAAQKAMEAELKRTTMADILSDLRLAAEEKGQ
jgi:Rrf2 family protein